MGMVSYFHITQYILTHSTPSEMYKLYPIHLYFMSVSTPREISLVKEARTHAHAEITYFPTRCIIGSWKAISLQPHASQGLMMHLVRKCAIAAWAWVLVYYWKGMRRTRQS